MSATLPVSLRVVDDASVLRRLAVGEYSEADFESAAVVVDRVVRRLECGAPEVPRRSARAWATT